MRFRKFVFFPLAALLVIGSLSVLLAPFAVAAGLRFWIARAAQQEGVRIEFEKIDAPLLRPVTLHNLQVNSQPDAPFRLKIESPRLELSLNLSAILGGSRGHILRALTADGITVDLRRNPESTSQRFAWRTLGDLLADNFRISGLQLHVENGDTVIDLQDGTLSGSQIEAGIFGATEISVVSPLFRKTFSQLRGTTSWQEGRLSIGALTLTRGLDIDAINIDLSQIAESRIGLELSIDAFGGKLRTSISSDDHADTRTWDVAGSASELSLAQLSEALDFTDCVGGSLHACKFTFRGETTNLRQATAAIWAEVTGLTWRDRTADSIILGASLYNRQVQIEQVFVKQRANQLTLTGESVLPEKLSDWLNPDFRGDISASIDDLGDFARLFGARPSDFAGKINIAGKVNARERKLGGQLMVSGKSLTVFRTPVESLDVKLNLKESELEITNIELCRKNDFFRGQANVDLARGGSYSGQFTISIAEAAEYVDLLPESIRSIPFGGNLSLDWAANGDDSGHRGTFHARGHGLHPLESSVIPFDVELDGEYAPGKFFFRQFHLSNPHTTIGAFLTVAEDYVQLQSLHLDLDGSSKIRGNIFLPIALNKFHWNNWVGSLNDNPSFDVDLALDPLDIAELAKSIFTQPRISGQASGSLQVQGAIEALEGKSIFHLQDFTFGNEPHLSLSWETQITHGIFQGNAGAVTQGSDPADLEWSVPYRFEKQEASYILRTFDPFSATLNFPAIFIAKVPRYLTRGNFVDGIFSGRLSLSDSPFDPQFTGDVQLINARFLAGPTLSTKLTFHGQSATVDFARITRDHTVSDGRGGIDFRDLTNITLELLPTAPMVVSTQLDPGDCITRIDLSPTPIMGARRERIGAFSLHGNLSSSEWTISLSEKDLDDPLETLLQGESVRTYPLCSNLDRSSRTMTLGMVRSLFP